MLKTTRRHFMQRTAAAGLGAALGPKFAHAASEGTPQTTTGQAGANAELLFPIPPS